MFCWSTIKTHHFSKFTLYFFLGPLKIPNSNSASLNSLTQSADHWLKISTFMFCVWLKKNPSCAYINHPLIKEYYNAYLIFYKLWAHNWCSIAKPSIIWKISHVHQWMNFAWIIKWILFKLLNEYYLNCFISIREIQNNANQIYLIIWRASCSNIKDPNSISIQWKFNFNSVEAQIQWKFNFNSIKN